jgi:chromosome segregation ATPase
MSLENPTILERAIQHKKFLVYGGLGLLLVGIALFLYQCGDDYVFKSKVQKQKDEISNTAQEIANVSNQIANLEIKKEGLQVNVNTATEQLQKDLFGLDAAKKETNQALANFQNAVNKNANIDRTLEDLNRVLQELDK